MPVKGAAGVAKVFTLDGQTIFLLLTFSQAVSVVHFQLSIVSDQSLPVYPFLRNIHHYS